MTFEDLIAWLDRPVATGRGRSYRLGVRNASSDHPVKSVTVFDCGSAAMSLRHTLRRLSVEVAEPLFLSGEGLVRSPGSECLAHPPAVVGRFRSTPTVLDIEFLRSAFGVTTLQVDALFHKEPASGSKDAAEMTSRALASATVRFDEFPREAHPYYIPELDLVPGE